MAKKLKAGSYEIGRLIDQSGGMNNAVYPALLNDNEAKLLKNATLDEKGTVKTCKGRRERFAERFSTDPVNGITAFYPDTATSRLVIGSGTKLYKDTPHLVNPYDSKADWDSGSKSNYCVTSDNGLAVEVNYVTKYGITDTGSLSVGSSAGDYEYGWRFTVGTQDITVDRLRYYCPEGNRSRTLRLWRHSDQTKLAEVTITTEKDKWVEGEITPQVLKAGEKYTVSFGYPGANQPNYRASNPTYSGDITFDAMVYNSAPGSYPTSAITYVYGIVDFADYATLDKTIQEDWADGEGENITIDNGIKLTKSGEYTDFTKADFEAGTLDGVIATVDGVELALRDGFLTGNPLSGYDDVGISGEYELLQGTLHVGETGVTGFASGKLTNGSWGTMVYDTNISNTNTDYVIWLFDLKANYSIQGIFFEWILHPDFPTAYGGQEVIAEYSEDGVSYTTLPAKDLSGITTGGNYLESWTGISATARYVRIKAKNKSSRFMIINDIGILGSAYSPQGTLVKEIDISTEAEVETTKIEWTSTEPEDTSITIETALSLDGGENYGEWQTATSGSAIPGITAETDLSNARLKYRATLGTEDTSVTPKLSSITIGINAEYAETGSWIGTVFDIIDIEPDTSKIEWTEDTPEGTTVIIETRGGYDGENWGDWTAQTSGEAVSTLNLYNQARVVMTSDGTATPTVSDLVLTVTAKGARAIWTSPTIDASNVTDKASGQAIMEYTGTAEVQSRSSADEGETWGAWVTAEADGKLNHTPNNHIQVRIIYLDTVQSLQVSFDEAPTATELATGFTAGSQFYFTTLLSKLIITNKLDAPRKWDGTNAVETLGGSPPHGQYTATHKNYVFMAHTSENPSRIYWSDLLDLETWGVLSYIDISPNDGDWITGLLPFSDYLIITKQRSVWVLVGDGPSSFEVRRIHDGVGCIAPRSLVKMEGVFSFVGTEGIYLSDLNMPIVITERLKKTWDELNKRRLTQAASVYYDHKLRIDLPDSASTKNNIRIIYDNIRKALYLQEFSKHASCYATFIEAGQEILLYGHSTEGQVSRADFGTTDAGEPITMVWETKWFNFGSSAVEKKVRRLYLVCVPASSDTEVNIYLVVDGVEDGEPLTVVIPGTPYDDEITVRLNPKDIDVRKIRTLGYRITQSTTNGGVQFHELLQEFRAKKVKAT